MENHYMRHQILNKNPHIFLRIFFILILLVSLRLFSFRAIDLKIFQYLELLLLFILALLCILNTKKVRGSFSKNFGFIVLFTLTASVPAYFFHGQGFFLSFFISRVVLYTFIYKFLHIYNFKVDFVLKVLFYIGWIWVAIMIIQAYTFPNIWFMLQDLDFNVILERARGEVLRLNIADVRYGVLLFFSLAFLIINNLKNYTKIFYIIIIAIAIFFTGTRQIVFTCVLLLIIMFLNSNPKRFDKRIINIIMLLPIFFLIFTFIFPYFTSLITKSNENFNMQYIRILEAKFYVFEYWPKNNTFFAYLFGNGWEHGRSDYGLEIQNYHWKRLRFYREDIGILGAFNKFGFMYVVSVIAFFNKILKLKFSRSTIFIKYFFLFLALTYFTGSNFFENNSVLFIIACLAFVVDKNVLDKKNLHK